MRHQRVTMLIVLMTVLAVSGCSSLVVGHAVPAAEVAVPSADDATPGSADDAGPGSADAPQADGVAWVDQVCGAFLDTHDALTDKPTPDPADVAATLDGYKQYFDRTLPALDTAITRLSAVGPSPLAGGDQLIANMVTLVTLLRDAYRSSQTAVNAIDPASPTAMSQDLPAALALTNVQDKAPEIDIAATPELNAAAEAAPRCRAVGG